MYVIHVQRTLSISITLFIGFAYAHATLKYTPSFSYPSRSCICRTLTYHIIMPCLSNCLFNTFIDPLLTFCSLRPSNNCLELPVVFFLCSPNIWYAKWFHIPFWKFCVVLSSRIDYKLASIAWCIRITLVYFRWDTMKRDMASEVAKTDRKKQQENTVERWFRQANTKHCQTLFDFPTRLIRINSMQNKWKAREYQ